MTCQTVYASTRGMCSNEALPGETLCAGCKPWAARASAAGYEFVEAMRDVARLMSAEPKALPESPSEKSVREGTDE